MKKTNKILTSLLLACGFILSGCNNDKPTPCSHVDLDPIDHTCDLCGEKVSQHTAGEAEYSSFSADHKCTGTIKCSECGETLVTETVQGSYQMLTAATCTQGETGKYVYDFTKEGLTDKEETGIILNNAIGHAFEQTWSSDEEKHWHACSHEGCNIKDGEAAHSAGDATYSQPTADHKITGTIKCSVCEKVLVEQTVTGTYEKVTDATCLAGETGKYVYDFTETGLEEQVENVSFNELAEHKADTAWKFDDTNHWHECKQEGCNAELNKAAHTADEATYSNPTADHKMTGTIKCSVCEKVLVEQTVTGTYQTVTDATCLAGETGKYVYDFTETGLVDKEETGITLDNAKGHEYVRHEATAPTVEATGNIEYYSCNNCDELFIKVGQDQYEITSLKDVTIAKLEQYIVTFDTNGGSSIDPLTVTEGDTFAALESVTAPTKTGYTFVKWQLVDGQNLTDIVSTDTIEGDITVKAVWTLNVYKIILKYNNGDADGEVNVNHGDLISSLPTNIELDENSEFVGWYADGSKLDGNTPITGEMTVYAGFKKSISLSDTQYIEIADGEKVSSAITALNAARSMSVSRTVNSTESIALANITGDVTSLKVGNTVIDDATFSNGSLSFAKSKLLSGYGSKTLTGVFTETVNGNPKLVTTVTIPTYVCDFAVRNADDLDAMQYVAHKLVASPTAACDGTGHIVLANDIVYNDGDAILAGKANNFVGLRQYDTIQNAAGDYWTGGFMGQFDGLGHNIEGLIMKEKAGMTGFFYILGGNTGYIKNVSFTHAVALGHGFLVGRLTHLAETAVMEHIAVQLDFMKGGKSCGAETPNGAGLVACGRNYNTTYVGDVFVKLDDYEIPTGDNMYGPFVWGSDSVDGFRCVCDLNLPMQKKALDPIDYCKDKPTAAFATYAEFKQCDKYGKMATSCTTFWSFMEDTYNSSYSVKFMNGDTELQSETLEYGQKPVFKGEEPESATEGAEFMGWDKEISTVQGETVYNARFGVTIESQQFVSNRDVTAGLEAYRTASGNTAYRADYVWDANYASFNLSQGGTVSSVTVNGEEKLSVAVIEGSTLKLPMSLFTTDGSTGTIVVKADNGATAINYNIKYTAADFVITTADDLDAMQYIAHSLVASPQYAHDGTGYFVLGKDIVYNSGDAVVADKANGYANLRQYDTIQPVNMEDYWSGGFSGTFDGLGHNIEGLVIKNKSGMTGLFYILKSGDILNYSVTHGVALGHGFIIGRPGAGTTSVQHVAIQLDYMAAGKSAWCLSGYTNANALIAHPKPTANVFKLADLFVQINEYETPGEGQTLPYAVGAANPSGLGCVVPDLNIRMWNTGATAADDVFGHQKPLVTFTSYSAFKESNKQLATVCETFWAYMEATYGA